MQEYVRLTILLRCLSINCFLVISPLFYSSKDEILVTQSPYYPESNYWETCPTDLLCKIPKAIYDTKDRRRTMGPFTLLFFPPRWIKYLCCIVCL